MSQSRPTDATGWLYRVGARDNRCIVGLVVRIGKRKCRVDLRHDLLLTFGRWLHALHAWQSLLFRRFDDLGSVRLIGHGKHRHETRQDTPSGRLGGRH
ncbi:hypothetical protein ASF32_03725 [Methylobacterium sp. Leaf91]|nr:hypothetical protein ASF24_17865 [Methylobacterium sp. Leaf86]KQO93342.1 hypothetical protein ASF32_03725 [Methylobacterium sp. Leaf91]